MHYLQVTLRFQLSSIFYCPKGLKFKKYLVTEVFDAFLKSKRIISSYFFQALEQGRVLYLISKFTDFIIHPIQVPRWPFDFAPGIKTKFKKIEQENKKNSLGPVVFPPRR